MNELSTSAIAELGNMIMGNIFKGVRTMLVWKAEYSIGVDIIDIQHKHLFEIIESAFKLLKNDFSDDKYNGIVTIIQDLQQYAKYHFITEEEYMIKIQYNGYFNQKVEHDEFIRRIEIIDFKQMQRDPQKYIEGILSFVLNWLIDHILLKDRQINQ